MKRLIVLLGVVGFSASAIVVRWSTAPSMVLVMYRMIVAVGLLSPVVLLRCRDELKALKKNSESTEDELKNAEKKMQDLTDKYCKEIDGHAARKEKEIMEF